jgi:hypothetical protein
MITFFKQVAQDAKALIRGERRVAQGLRGRTHGRKEGDGGLNPKAKPKMKIEINYIEDADTGIRYSLADWQKLKKEK